MQLGNLEAAAGLLGEKTRGFVHGTATEPRVLVEHWLARPESLRGVELLTSFIPGINNCQLAGLAERQHVTAFMNSADYAEAQAAGDLTALRLSYSEVGQYLTQLEQLDVAFVQVAPMSDGGFSTGLTGALLPTAIEKARRICLVVNEQMPIPANGYAIPAERADMCINVSRPLLELPSASRPPDAVSREIASRVSTLINDGDTLQAGLGAVPGALFENLTDHRSLRIYSGMVSDAFMPLYESGALDNDAEHIIGMVMGSQRLYRWFDGRPGCRIAGVEETHNRHTIATIDSFVAVNSAISVGLNGAVNAERIGSHCVSGPGGLPDFAAGASGAPNGRSVIALPSTNSAGTVSRIVADIGDASSATVPGEHVTHVATEFGVAAIAGVSATERAERLIAIAHPGFREQLSSEPR